MRKPKSRVNSGENVQEIFPASSSVKKISFGAIVNKTVEILKKPFKTAAKKQKAGNNHLNDDADKKDSQSSLALKVDHLEDKKDKAQRQSRRPSKRKQQAAQDAYDEGEDQDASDKKTDSNSAVSAEVNNFFYTSDKAIARLEDNEILGYLKDHYPLFMKDPSDFQTQKKQILAMLSDARFMDQFLSFYDMNIYEFFKFLFRIEPDLFKGSFLTRIQKAMRWKKYAIEARRCSYLGRKKARISQLKRSKLCRKACKRT